MMRDERVEFVPILGTNYPLCYTVGAAQEVDNAFGGLEGLRAALSSEDSNAAALRFAEIMLRGGYDRVAVLARMSGDPVPNKPPTAEELQTSLTPPELLDLTQSSFRAFAKGVSRTVEAEPSEPKNAVATQ